MANIDIDEIKKTAEQIRKDCIWMSTRADFGHLAPALSIADILATLYKKIMVYDPKNPHWPLRDRFILSKGHGCLALYSILSQVGYFDRNLLRDFANKYDTMLPGHPEIKLPGIEANTGSLGHGIPLAIGMALAAKIDNKNYRVFVITGDGELEEGTNWEAAIIAAKHKVDNLIVIVDRNKLQLGDLTENISQLEPLEEKWKAFGWATKVINGHDINDLISSLNATPHEDGKPTVIIANTIKGKGLPVAENKIEWHHKVLTKEQYNALKNDLGLEELSND